MPCYQTSVRVFHREANVGVVWNKRRQNTVIALHLSFWILVLRRGSPSWFHSSHLIRDWFTAGWMQLTQIGKNNTATSPILRCAFTCFMTECTYYRQKPTLNQICKISPISGTDKATVMATQTKKAGRRIWEKRPLVFLLAQWNRLMMRPWNWLSFNHQPSNLKLPCPSRISVSGDEGFSASPGGEGDTVWERQNGLIIKWIRVTMHACLPGWFSRLDNTFFAEHISLITVVKFYLFRSSDCEQHLFYKRRLR